MSFHRFFSECKLIHAGGEAFVYKANYKNKQTVALKVYKENIQFNESFYAAIKKNKHLNVAPIIDYGFSNGQFWTCSDYINGVTSSSVSPMLVPIALHLMRGVVSGLLFLEQLGYSHGDLSPDNLMLSPSGNAVLIDGGIVGVGHICYAAPERFEKSQATSKTDLFSLGILLYYWLTGSLPFKYENYDRLAEELLHFDSKSISLLLHAQGNFSVEEIVALEPLWHGLLRVNPEERFSDFDELEERLELALLKMGKAGLVLEPNYKKWLESISKKAQEQELLIDAMAVKQTLPVKRSFKRPIILMSLLFLLLAAFFLFWQQKSPSSVLETGAEMLERSRSREVPAESEPPPKEVIIENAPRPIDFLDKELP